MYKSNIEHLNQNGYAIINRLYSQEEVHKIINCIELHHNASNANAQDVFAIRQFIKTIPTLKPLLFNRNLITLLTTHFKTSLHLCKAIYFNKPPNSNWFVAYHQDLSISVKERIDVKGYTQWTKKKGQIGVIPPTKILENILTVRIHLDDTTEHNGALKIIPESHNKDIIRPETINHITTNEVVCNVDAGGIMLMRPLTLHASNKTTNNKPRRVIHLEFSSLNLERPLEWLEKETI